MVELNRLFPVPRAVVDVRLEENEFIGFEEAQGELPEDVTLPPGSIIKIPTEFEIISQRVRTKADGSSVVDVIVDFPGSNENLEYDVRVYQNDND